MVCENPYEFGDGINITMKQANRIQTATGNGTRLNYFNNQDAGSMSNG